MVTIDSIKAEIKLLNTQLEKEKSPSERQKLVEKIATKKRQIEKLSKEEKRAVPVIDAPIIAERRYTKPSRFTDTNVRL